MSVPGQASGQSLADLSRSEMGLPDARRLIDEVGADDDWGQRNDLT